MTFTHRALDQAHKQTISTKTPTHHHLIRIIVMLTAAILLPVLSANSASAATAAPKVTLTRINGNIILQGWNFKANTTGQSTAKIGSTSGAKQVRTNSTGYFWMQYAYFTNLSGSASATATVNGQRASTTTTISANGGSAPAAPTTTAPAPVKSAAPVVAAPSAAPADNSSAPAGWKLAWSDEFNDNKVDEGKWGIYQGNGNGGTAHRSRANVSESNGELTILGQNNMAGGVGSKTSWTYGRWEVRAKVDKGAGYGAAILLWPSSENWPIDGELDLSEIVDANRTKSGSHAHWGANNTAIHHEEQADFSQWHTFALDWQPDHLTYYLDGRAIWNITDSRAIPKTRHFLGMQFDTADGNYIQGSSGGNAVRMHIDYARVYTR